MNRQTGKKVVVGWVSHITIIDPRAGANWLSPVCLFYTMPLTLSCHYALTHICPQIRLCAHGGNEVCQLRSRGLCHRLFSRLDLHCLFSHLKDFLSFSPPPFIIIETSLFASVFVQSKYRRMGDPSPSPHCNSWNAKLEEGSSDTVACPRMSEGQLIWHSVDHTHCHFSPLLPPTASYAPSPSFSKEQFF